MKINKLTEKQLKQYWKNTPLFNWKWNLFKTKNNETKDNS